MEEVGEGLQSRPIPHPNHAGRKKRSFFFFFGASPLNAQRSPDFGHENGIIPSHNKMTHLSDCMLGFNRLGVTVPYPGFRYTLLVPTVSEVGTLFVPKTVGMHTFFYRSYLFMGP